GAVKSRLATSVVAGGSGAVRPRLVTSSVSCAPLDRCRGLRSSTAATNGITALRIWSRLLVRQCPARNLRRSPPVPVTPSSCPHGMRESTAGLTTTTQLPATPIHKQSPKLRLEPIGPPFPPY